MRNPVVLATRSGTINITPMISQYKPASTILTIVTCLPGHIHTIRLVRQGIKHHCQVLSQSMWWWIGLLRTACLPALSVTWKLWWFHNYYIPDKINKLNANRYFRLTWIISSSRVCCKEGEKRCEMVMHRKGLNRGLHGVSLGNVSIIFSGNLVSD